MGRSCGLRSCAWACAAGVLAACAGTAAAADLEVGSPAPPIDVEHWFEDAACSGPVEAFEAGKVYVIEFWATWCPPCRASIPHLAEVQERFADKGVTIIGVSDEEEATVAEFLETASRDTTFGALTRKYRLATDPDGSVHCDYMEASGEAGIPTAFIVGKTGEVEWIGPPMEMDEPLAEIVDGTWDRAEFAAAQRERVEVDDRFEEISRLFGEGKVDAAVDLLDGVLPGVKDAKLRAKLEAVRAQLAIRAGGPRAVEAFDTALAAAGDSVAELNELAWAVVALGAEGEAPPPDLVKSALGAALKAADLAAENGPVLDTLAHLQAMTGDFAAALATQRKAATHAGHHAEEIDAYLEELERRVAEQ